MVKNRRLVPTRENRRRRSVGQLVRAGGPPGRHAAGRLVGYLNAASDYEAFCAAELRNLPRSVQSAASAEMLRPGSAWRIAYGNVQIVEALVLDSLDLLATGQLTTAAMRRFNEHQEREQSLIPRLGQAWRGGMALSLEERVIPEAPTVARLMPRDGADPIAALYDVIATGMLNRLRRCPQCHRWFVDESRNRTGTRCSIECTNRWWTRERRRDADHGRKRRKRR